MISFLFTVRQPFRFFIVVVYVLGIVALSLLPPQDLPKIPFFKGADKVIHIMMYFIFSILFSWAIRTEINYYRLLLVITITIGWGVFMEYLQLKMHLGRSFDINDITANSLGVITGVLIYVLASLKE